MSLRARQVMALSRLAILDLYRRKDLIVVFLLSAVILLPLAFFSPFGVTGASRYMNELTLLLVWLFSLVIGLGVSARLFPPEFESRTIYPLLAKPVGRGTILLGKYLGALTASFLALAVFYLAYAVLIGCRQGTWFPLILLQGFILHTDFLLVLTALGLLGSLLLTPSANLTLCSLLAIVMLVFGQQLPALIAAQPVPGKWALQVLHWFGPHLEFFDLRQRMIHAWPPIQWRVCAAVSAYAVCYTAACLLLAAVVFRKKRF